VNVTQTGISFNKDQAIKVATRYGRNLATSAALDVRAMRQASTHASAEKREAAIDKYIGEHYADVTLPEASSAALTRLRTASAAKTLFKRVHDTHEVRDELVSGDVKSAAGKLDVVQGGADSFFKYTAYQVRRAQFEGGGGQQRYTQAMTNLTQAVDSSTATPSVFAALAVELANTGHTSDALARIDQAGHRFGSESSFWPVKISVQQKAGQRTQADQTLALCHSQGGDKLQSLCDDAYKQADPAAAAAGQTAGKPTTDGTTLKDQTVQKLQNATSFVEQNLNPLKILNRGSGQ
jgi:hypothetical protein